MGVMDDKKILNLGAETKEGEGKMRLQNIDKSFIIGSANYHKFNLSNKQNWTFKLDVTHEGEEIVYYEGKRWVLDGTIPADEETVITENMERGIQQNFSTEDTKTKNQSWTDGLDIEEIVKEVQYHFDRLLGRKNLNVTVKGDEGDVFRCRPFDYRVIRGNKITESISCGEMGNVHVNLWVSSAPVKDQTCYFVSSGRRISEISDIKSFMKASLARWSVWNHPNLVGYIEVGDVLEPVITRDEFRRTSTRAKVYKTIIKEVEPVLGELINNANKKRRVLEMGKLGSIISKCFNVAIRKESDRGKQGKTYVDYLHTNRGSSTKKRSLEDLEAEEKLALSANMRPELMDGIAMPAKKKRKIDKQKAQKVSKKGSGKFRMVFVNDLKDSQGLPKRAQLIGDDVYINVQHPDFEGRVNYSRKSGKMNISERLCSYLANIAATAYKANMIQRSREGLKLYHDRHFQLFDEILDLEFAIESQLRKYLPAIQREVDGADFDEM